MNLVWFGAAVRVRFSSWRSTHPADQNLTVSRIAHLRTNRLITSTGRCASLSWAAADPLFGVDLERVAERVPRARRPLNSIGRYAITGAMAGT